MFVERPQYFWRFDPCKLNESQYLVKSSPQNLLLKVIDSPRHSDEHYLDIAREGLGYIGLAIWNNKPKSEKDNIDKSNESLVMAADQQGKWVVLTIDD